MENIIKNIDTIKTKKFEIYYNFLISENEKYNLTSIIDIDEVYVKHFYDSYCLRDYVDLDNKEICDIGSGAGFPGIPLKIMNDSIKLTIIEPTQKRINFLKELCQKLEINDVTFINERAEEAIINYRGHFDYVVARAVTSLPILLELSIPYLKVGGKLIAYKGRGYLDEIELSINALDTLNAKITDIYRYSLFEDYGDRYLIEVTKTGRTNPKYPRQYAKIKNRPL